MKLLRVSVVSAGETAIRLLAMLFLVKFLAQKSGPEGLASFSQFQNFVGSISVFCSGAFTVGLVSHSAKGYAVDRNETFHLRNAVGIALLLSSLAAASLVITSDLVTRLLFGDNQFEWIVLAFSAALIPITMFNVTQASLNGHEALMPLIGSKVLLSVLLIIVSGGLIARAGTAGALLGQVLGPPLALVILALFYFKSVAGSIARWLPTISCKGIKDFLPFWVMSLISAISTTVVLLACRLNLANQLSWRDAGIWDATLRVGDLHIIIITTALTIYYVPKLSTSQTRSEQVASVNAVFLVAVGIAASLAAVSYVMGSFIVSIMFSKEFLEVTSYLPIVLVATVIKIGAWVISYHMIVHKRVATFIFTEIAFGISFLASTHLLTSAYGLYGAMLAFALSNILYGSICVIYYLRRIQVS